MGVLAAALGWHVGHTAFDDLEQFLLGTLSGNVPRNGPVDSLFPGNLVQLINVYDTVLSPGNVPVGGLNQSEQYVLHVFADVAGFGQRGGVAYGKGDIQGAGQSLRQHVLPHPVGPSSKILVF